MFQMQSRTVQSAHKSFHCREFHESFKRTKESFNRALVELHENYKRSTRKLLESFQQASKEVLESFKRAKERKGELKTYVIFYSSHIINQLRWQMMKRKILERLEEIILISMDKTVLKAVACQIRQDISKVILQTQINNKIAN